MGFGKRNASTTQIVDTINRIRSIPHLRAGAIVALGMLLRVAYPTLAEFKLDEATVIRRAMAIAWRGDLPATGVISSVGIANPPLTLYLTALPLRIWSDPVAAVVFIGLLNGIAIIVTYEVGKRYLDRSVGEIAAFLFAVNPWAVLLARKIWAKTLPVLIIALIAALLAAFVRRRPWALAGAFAATTALIGLQLEGIAFVPLLGLSMLMFRKEIAIRPFLAGLGIMLMGLGPYVVYDALHGWPNLRMFMDYIKVGRELRPDEALRYAFFLTSGADLHAMAGARYQEYLNGLPRLEWLNTGMMGLLVASLPYAAIRALQGPEERRRTFLILLMGFVIPVAMRSRVTDVVHLHYLIVIYPTVFLLVAAFIDYTYQEVFRRSPLIARLAAVSLILIWGAWQLIGLGRLFWFMDRYPTTGGYGIPLKYPREAAREAVRQAHGAEIIVLTDGADPAFEERPAVFDALLFLQPHRLVDGRISLLVPDAARAVYIVGPISPQEDALRPIERRLQGMAGVRMAKAIEMPDGWKYRIYQRERSDREDALAGLTRMKNPPRFANGVALLGYEMPSTAMPGEALEVWTAWWVQAPPPPGESYHFFIHLLDKEGRLRSQHDGAPFLTRFWHVGDLVLSRFRVQIPERLEPGTYEAWFGVYTYPDIRRVHVVDPAGNPAHGAIRLGTVRIDGQESGARGAAPGSPPARDSIRLSP